ncbi:MAG: cupin domain-containing protein [Kiritimatiellae bacterium]|jgi:mannose-6-phosphate isomerase-like protein (cupin superfamily)|nr:cupin domain-containing protein [Kiritimatiellia bacterium]
MTDQIDNMQLAEPARREALRRVAEQLRNWGLSMPSVDPLVMDFGQGNFDGIGLVEYWIANEVTVGYCGKYLFLFNDQQCPFHSHQDKHETFFVVKGEVRMVVDSKEQIMKEGDVLAMPAGNVHSFTGIGNTLILELSTPCLVDDNCFQEPGIAKWLTQAKSVATRDCR